MFGLNAAAHAELLPNPDDLQAQIGSEAIPIIVFEPHLSTAQENVPVEYVGYPAEYVLAAVLGESWREISDAIEFRALDGYASRIEVSKFTPENAFVVFSRGDGAAFTIDNLAQNERDVPLGPYYLVWNNIVNPELLAEGAGIWPYQISEILSVTESDAALLPEGLEVRYHGGAALAKAYCLNCHAINGYGGKKIDGDIAHIAKALSEENFTRWVLNPTSVRDGTTMPALSAQLDLAERTQIAKTLYNYLVHLPEIDSINDEIDAR
jgi:mono/diheme cytochrome c family protein